jgi:hypothetical protein
VSYYENVADDFAERVYKVLHKDFGYTVYVNHILRDKMPGDYELNIDNIIENCKVFILLNTRGALSRPKVIREVKVAFPMEICSDMNLGSFVKKVMRFHSEQTSLRRKLK